MNRDHVPVPQTGAKSELDEKRQMAETTGFDELGQ